MGPPPVFYVPSTPVVATDGVPPDKRKAAEKQGDLPIDKGPERVERAKWDDTYGDANRAGGGVVLQHGSGPIDEQCCGQNQNWCYQYSIPRHFAVSLEPDFIASVDRKKGNSTRGKIIRREGREKDGWIVRPVCPMRRAYIISMQVPMYYD